jgi:adenylate cyclase
MTGVPGAVHVVTVIPSYVRLSVNDGETLYLAARRQGISWPTRCLGKASCRQCFFEVAEAQSDALASASRIEQDALRRLDVGALEGMAVRLACQARVHGDLQVFRVGVHAE